MKNAELKISERALLFAIRIVKLVNFLPKTSSGFAIGSQIVRSGTSIGANLQEAQSGSSKKDFIHCITISLKEARETEYWLIIISKSGMIKSERLDLLLVENDEIIRILVTIIKNAKNNS